MTPRPAYWILKEDQAEAVRLSADKAVPDKAMVLSNENKVELIAGHFREIMCILGLDLNDDSLADTPHRVARLYVHEIFSGINSENKPGITLFDNKYHYDQMLIIRDITIYSHCAHHFMPIIGRVHVGYISSGKVIGLSKINRLAQYYASRPQLPERLVVEIAQGLMEVLDTEDVAVTMDATYLCVASRGVEDSHSSSVSSHYCGKFREEKNRSEFLQSLLSNPSDCRP